MRILTTGLLAIVCTLLIAPAAHAQEAIPSVVTFQKAKVLEIVSEETREIPGTNTPAKVQTIKVEILDGDQKGKILTLENDYLSLKVGETFYLRHEVDGIDGQEYYAVADPYRLPTLLVCIALFLVVLFAFGGKQGLRGLLALIGSLFFIGYLLVPGILSGYSPVLVSMGVSSLIIILGSYVTHGFNRTTTAAVIGMLLTILVTGILAYLAIHFGRLSGFTSEENVYLNFNTQGSIDLVGLLLGGIMIGLLGVLYDAAIGQAIAVEELYHVGTHISRAEIYKRAIRIGREHIGALVNTLAIAYVGASLPLLLLLELAPAHNWMATINQELFATEIIRTMIGSIGLILAVPITTAIALYVLSSASPRTHAETHHH